jgi:integrase
VAVFPIDITPSVADVAALLRARNNDSRGEEIGTFNYDTRPTSAQVLPLIDEAVTDIQARMGLSPPLESVGLHEARHAYASYLIAAGVDMKAIGEYMGHTSVAFTYDRYGHLLPGSTAENAAKLDAYLARARSHGRSHEV